MKKEKLSEDLQHNGLRTQHYFQSRTRKQVDFKYVDFSHANAYDTLLRPLQTVVNAVQDGNTDNDGMMDDFSKGVY